MHFFCKCKVREELLRRFTVGVCIFLVPAKGTERAFDRTDVCIVGIGIYNKCHLWWGMFFFSSLIRHFFKFAERCFLYKISSFLNGNSTKKVWQSDTPLLFISRLVYLLTRKQKDIFRNSKKWYNEACWPFQAVYRFAYSIGYVRKVNTSIWPKIFCLLIIVEFPKMS